MIERLRLQEYSASPQAQHDRLRSERERVTSDVRRKLADDTAKLAAFDAAFEASKLYSSARERNKTTSIRVLQEARVALRVLSSRLVDQGHFSEPEDINMIREDELDLLIDNPARYGKIAAERLEWADRLQQLEPPYVVNGAVPPPSTWKSKKQTDIEVATSGDVLAGISACPGVATGRARIIENPDDAENLDVGDILVAPMTDPGWMPLFVSAAAVVVNVGSELSHAAIASRELGVPAVVGLSGATRRIPDGALVRVDGSAGTVTLL